MFTSLINLFYPNICAGCESFLLQDEKVLCTRCRHEIPLTHHILNPNNEAFSKFYGKVPVEFAAAFLYFHKKGRVQELIHKLKYKGHEEIGMALGYWFAEELKQFEPIKDVSCIIPVPLHPKKLRERGYNQVTSFGKALSENLNIPFEENVLIRNLYTKTQTKKNLLGRTELAKNLFDITDDISLNGNHIILVDDVITTGSTLEKCCNALLKIPNVKVSVLCMAMTH
jgi:ComF family protein